MVHKDPANEFERAEKAVLTAIGVGRIVWGTVTAVAPGRVHRLLGVDYPGPDHGIWIKAFGVRDIVLGAAALHRDANVRSATLRAGIVMDLVDAGVVVSAGAQGLPRRATVAGLVLAGGTAAFAAFGPRALTQLRNRK